jgi:hypothetical protein
METCYYCEEPLNVVFNPEGGGVEDVSGDVYFCDDCHRWQCNTQECGCVCSMTDGDLYSSFTGDMTASEVLEIGLEDLNVHIAELWRDTGFMDGFQYKYLPHLASDQERIKALAETIYEYARSYDR